MFALNVPTHNMNHVGTHFVFSDKVVNLVGGGFCYQEGLPRIVLKPKQKVLKRL